MASDEKHILKNILNLKKNIHVSIIKIIKYGENFQTEYCSFIIFTDASKEAYGFVVYCVQGLNSQLLFSKFKLAPIPQKTLPSLELLAMYLSMQCVINIIFNSNFNLKTNNITFLTDSQVALSWVLTEKVIKKNTFVSNRLY